jgi:hypothetical protein
MAAISFFRLLIPACLLCLACGGLPPQVIDILVSDEETELGLDSVQILLYRQFGETAPALIDSQWTSADGTCELLLQPEAGYAYFVRAHRSFYQEAVAAGGGTFLNQADVMDTDSQQIILLLEPIPAPDPERFEKMHESVPIHEVIATLRSDGWEWAFLPHMAWEDIPSLLAVGQDSAYVHQYPHHPRTTYQPDSVRVGLVALWLIETIRKSEIKHEEFIHLMPPSRAPVLGTRKGNPSGYNSISQMNQAWKGYQNWWEAAQDTASRSKSIRSNPLKGLGMSWM